VAVLGDEADLVRVARLADVSEDEAAVAIRQLTARELLDRQSLAVIHPVVRAAVIEQIPHAVLDRLHLLAARVLAETNGSPSTAAAHLVITSPAGDDATVEVLRAAAESAMAAGDAAGAVRFLTRAVAEPPAPTRLAGILVELARAESAAGDPAASSRFEQAIDHLGSARDRAEARLAQGHALIQATRWADAAAAFEAGLDLVEVDQVELKSRLEAGYIASAFVGIADHAEAKRRLDHILRSPLHDPAQRELAAWSAFQATLTVEGTVDDVVALARRAVKGAELAELAHGSQVIELVAGVLLATGQLDEDVDLLDRALVAAQASNAHAKVGVYSYCRSLPFYLAGRLQDAIADGEMALAVHEHGWETFYPGTCASLAWSHLERGELETAERLVAIDDEVWGQRLDFQFMLQIARGRVASARGDVAEAVAQFERARAAGNAMGVFSTQVLADWRTWSAAALRGLGRQDEAIEVANEALTLAERWQEPIARGRAHWALGIALGGADGIEHLRLARAELDTSVAQLERARAALDLGAALRRSGHLTDARESLVAAADLAHRLGAFAIRDRARSELVAAGARPRRYALTGVDALTPSELRVAQLAAAGRTNREVAQSLFVTPKAVEYHLANAYRKLGIGSREELPRALEPVEQLASV
ncbi:MAG: LuxR C-terminal-related transcriptional regulator, partial [Candidatus Limnocylindria bacterium]